MLIKKQLCPHPPDCSASSSSSVLAILFSGLKSVGWHLEAPNSCSEFCVDFSKGWAPWKELKILKSQKYGFLPAIGVLVSPMQLRHCSCACSCDCLEGNTGDKSHTSYQCRKVISQRLDEQSWGAKPWWGPHRSVNQHPPQGSLANNKHFVPLLPTSWDKQESLAWLKKGVSRIVCVYIHHSLYYCLFTVYIMYICVYIQCICQAIHKWPFRETKARKDHPKKQTRESEMLWNHRNLSPPNPCQRNSCLGQRDSAPRAPTSSHSEKPLLLRTRRRHKRTGSPEQSQQNHKSSSNPYLNYLPTVDKSVLYASLLTADLL